MRIVDRKTFLALPEGTLCAKYSTLGNFGDLMLKGATWGSDFWYQSLPEVDADDSNAFFDTMLAAEKGEPFKLDLDCQSRDGLFDEDQRFVVWDADDLRQLIARLQTASKEPTL